MEAARRNRLRMPCRQACQRARCASLHMRYERRTANGGVCVNACSTLFRKHVLPALRRPAPTRGGAFHCTSRQVHASDCARARRTARTARQAQQPHLQRVRGRKQRRRRRGRRRRHAGRRRRQLADAAEGRRVAPHAGGAPRVLARASHAVADVSQPPSAPHACATSLRNTVRARAQDTLVGASPRAAWPARRGAQAMRRCRYKSVPAYWLPQTPSSAPCAPLLRSRARALAERTLLLRLRRVEAARGRVRATCARVGRVRRSC